MTKTGPVALGSLHWTSWSRRESPQPNISVEVKVLLENELVFYGALEGEKSIGGKLPHSAYCTYVVH